MLIQLRNNFDNNQEWGGTGRRGVKIEIFWFCTLEKISFHIEVCGFVFKSVETIFQWNAEVVKEVSQNSVHYLITVFKISLFTAALYNFEYLN